MTSIASPIVCEKCGQVNSQVVDTRQPDGIVRRRRECMTCKTRWYTFEIGEQSMNDLKTFLSTPPLELGTANKVISILRNAITTLTSESSNG